LIATDFTHFYGRTNHSHRPFTVCRITAKKRMVAKLKAIKAEPNFNAGSMTVPARLGTLAEHGT
jgi:hypothetical protein